VGDKSAEGKARLKAARMKDHEGKSCFDGLCPAVVHGNADTLRILVEMTLMK
jgi:hypothetical protein